MDAEAHSVSIKDRLLKERHALLDLSTRNRLLNTPLRTRNNRAIEIVDEKAEEVLRLLVAGRSLSFLPGTDLTEEERAALDPDDDVTGGIPLAPDDPVDGRGFASRHSDLKLQTRLSPDGLQKRLFDVWYDAGSMEQETGINVLYLAIGLLRWFDSESSEIARHAPLILLPVQLQRTSAADRFKLTGRDEPPSPNLTLQAKMKAEFALVIDDFKDEDEVSTSAYCARIAETVASKKRWEVLTDAMVLGFFSFSKFLMYRDLDPENWPAANAIDANDAIRALLRDGFPESEALVSDAGRIDEAITPLEQRHVVDADSSQSVAIAEAARGRTLVVKGPPGTGKSQTITNIIAAAVAEGRKVLFVAEKMAALDVVHRRLRNVGLGPLTLELHSNKANKKAILEELRRTRDAVPRPPRSDLTIISKLGDTTKQLNAFAERLHKPLNPSGLSPFAVLGRLVSADVPEAQRSYRLDGAESWDVEAYRRCRTVVAEVAERLAVVGPPPQHDWRGVCRGALDPSERTQLKTLIEEVARVLSEALSLSEAATSQLRLPLPDTFVGLEALLEILNATPLPAGIDRTALGSPAWVEQRPEDLSKLADAGRASSQAWARVEATFNASGQTADYTTIRQAIVIKGGSLFRFLDGNYRGQIALLQSYLVAPLPKAQTERLALVDDIISAKAARAAIAEARDAAKAFGSAWQGDRSDWDAISRIAAWRTAHAGVPDEAWPSLAGLVDTREMEACRDKLAACLPRLNSGLRELLSSLELDLQRGFATNDVAEISLSVLGHRLAAWQADTEGLSRFVAFAAATRRLVTNGAPAFADAVHDGALDLTTLLPTFEFTYAEDLRKALFSDWPELKEFDGESHTKLVDLFRNLDRARIGLAQEQIASAHAESRPRGAAGIGPLGVLNAEIARKRGHLPIRLLLERAGPAIQQLKPVFMMSPLSVAQFLKPGGLTFDLLVMDEASQIEPVDALGAIARVRQLVVVGDERQLPPTTFFKKMSGEEEGQQEDEGITIQAKDAESILELCLAKGVPYRMLSWHYRSKHQSLIAVSNREFYENKLFIVPSPYDAISGMGLKFNLLKNAPYDRGGTRTNPTEAKTIANAVIQHARATPELSLGVATFSVAQRQLVLKELELLRRDHSDLEEFFGPGAAEPFFVKNLENIQGDERDVIFISVGYGKNEQGYLAHAFGPLSGEGGERRLNVLISRAKLRCEVFCNFQGSDIDLERTRARGVAALKLFLTFAETGHFGQGEVTGADFDSEFEIDVCERLTALGYDVKRQIGASGFRVDLAVVDPETPGRFVLGIECDGAQFHSSRSARDRDRLRQQVLEAHGWLIHRVWSADWYLRPQHELKKIEDAVVHARSAWKDRDEGSEKATRTASLSFKGGFDGDTEFIDAIVEPLSPASRPARPPYVEASFAVNRELEPHDTSLADLAAVVVRIVESEGPVHIDEIAVRVRQLWGFARAGARMKGAVVRAADTAFARGMISSGPFHAIPGRPVVVRNRAAVLSLTLRKPEFLPPSEIDALMLELVDGNFGASRDELVQTASRELGFASTSAQLRAGLLDRITDLIAAGALVENGSLLVRSKAS